MVSRWRRSLRVLLAVGSSFALWGCPDPGSAVPSASTSTSASTSASAPSGHFATGAAPSRVTELVRAEDTRSVSLVTQEDLAHADPRVRRAAVRALARAEQGSMREHLVSVLADRDPEVLAWAAYGLGEICAWDRDRTARRLITRAVALGVEPVAQAGRLDPWFAIARALGKCGNNEAERTLVAWLSGPKSRSIAAAKGLGNVVTRNKRMAEETAAALLRATRGDAANDPLSEGFYPFGRLERAPVRVEQQLLESCRARLGHDVAARVFVIRSLSTVGEDAVKVLGSVLTAETGYSSAERAEAARALGKIGTKGAQTQLVRAIDQLAPSNDPVALTSLVGPGFGVLMATLGAVHVSGKRRVNSPGIDVLLSLESPAQAPLSVVRRIGHLRCAAAKLVAGRDHQHPKLTSCDPEDGKTGMLARLTVLDRAELQGAQFSTWKTYLDTKHEPVIREAALRMLASHPEARAVAPFVALALEDKQPGVVAEAATLVYAYPDRFFIDDKKANAKEAGGESKSSKADPAIVKALTVASARAWSPNAIETMGAVARACGALHVEPSRKWLDALCASPNPTLRAHAKEALSAFRGAKPTCEASSPYAPAPELERLVTENKRVELDTDVGKLTIELEPDLAPVAVTRVVELLGKKFYDGLTVHRVVPGFVVQFGDPGGDGFGGAEGQALRCETSPVPFDQGVVGVALGGRDTGSSQLFVTLASSPHLDGEYAVIGKATGPWDSLVEGDKIRSARRVP